MFRPVYVWNARAERVDVLPANPVRVYAGKEKEIVVKVTK
jgi:hypothetical protein